MRSNGTKTDHPLIISQDTIALFPDGVHFNKPSHHQERTDDRMANVVDATNYMESLHSAHPSVAGALP